MSEPIQKLQLTEKEQNIVNSLDSFTNNPLVKFDSTKIKMDGKSMSLYNAATYLNELIQSDDPKKKEKALKEYDFFKKEVSKKYNSAKTWPSYKMPFPSPMSKTEQVKEKESEYVDIEQKFISDASKSKTKKSDGKSIKDNLKEIEQNLLQKEKEILKFIEGDKSSPSSYYISKGWGDRLQRKIDSYFSLYNVYEEQLNLAKTLNVNYKKNSDISSKKKINEYNIYVSNSKKIDLYMDELKRTLRNTEVSKYHVIIKDTMDKVRPLISGPLERKFKLDDRSYFNNLSKLKRFNVNSKSNLAYLELMYAVSKDEKFINSEFIRTMEGPGKNSLDYGNVDLNSVINAYKDISVFGKYELYEHFDGKMPTYTEEFGTLLLGMSIMGYDSSAHVLDVHGSNLYGRFDYEGSLLVMQYIGSATIYAESICDYKNLDNYINSDVADGFKKSRNLDIYRARKQAGIRGREKSQTVGSPGEGVERAYRTTSSRAKVTAYLTLIEDSENTSGFYVRKPVNLFDSNLAFKVKLKNLRESMEELLSQKVNINVSAPYPESKIPLLPIDLNGFAYRRYLPTELDSLNANMSEDFDYEKEAVYDDQGEKISDVRKKDSRTIGVVNVTGETSSISGKGTYRYKDIEKDNVIESRTDEGSYDLKLDNIYGVRGFAKGKFSFSDYRETRELEKHFVSTNTFKDSDIIFYVKETKSRALDQSGEVEDIGKLSSFELQTFVKTKLGWTHVGTDKLDSNVNSLYGQLLVNLSEQTFVEGGSSGLIFYGNTDEKVLEQLKEGINPESDFYGNRETEFEGVGGGAQIDKIGMGYTYQRAIEGKNRHLILGAFNGLDVKGWGGVYVNPPGPSNELDNSKMKMDTDIAKQAPITKERQSKSDILEENLEGIGFREITYISMGKSKVMNDSFLQLNNDYKEVYAGSLARVILESGTFFGGSGIYNQLEDQGKGSAYLSNKERTKFITAQIIGEEMNIDAVTSGYVYKNLFGCDVNMTGFANYQDEQNTTFGAEFDYSNKRIVLYSIGGETQSGVLAEDDKHLFAVVGGKVVPYRDLEQQFSIESYGLIGENALGLGPGGFANPQYIGEGWAMGAFGGGTTEGYGTASLYGVKWNENYSLVLLGSWAKSKSEDSYFGQVSQVEIPIFGRDTEVQIPIFSSIQNEGNIFELSGVSQFYLSDSLDLNLGALWTGQFNKDSSSANMFITKVGIEKRVSWPYSLEIYNDTVMQWINKKDFDAFNAQSNLNLRLNYKAKFYIEGTGGFEFRGRDLEGTKNKKAGVNFDLVFGLDF